MERGRERMRMLHEAAVEGSMTSLLSLLQEDALILDRCIAGCFTETPLHIAAMFGHSEFAIEILTRKPELAKVLDFERVSPLHLATANGYIEVVQALLLVNPEMCLSQDWNGRNPLHLAVIKGQIDVLKELFLAKPEAALVRADNGESILHLCVIHFQMEALRFLVESINDNNFVNSKDDDGFTVLHLAVAEKQIESVKFLITNTAIDIHALNKNGFTALDLVLAQSRRRNVIMKDIEIKDFLLYFGALRTIDISSSSREEPGIVIRVNALSSDGNDDHRIQNSRNNQVNIKHGDEKNRRQTKKKNWLEQKRNTLMVVASLIATVNFECGINPPGGVWQDDTDSHKAGSSIMADKYPNLYKFFANSNTVGFLASLSVILLLISGLPFKRRVWMWILTAIMWLAITSMAITYSVCTSSLSRKYDNEIKIDGRLSYVLDGVTSNIQFLFIIAWFSLLILLFLGHAVRLIKKMIISFRRRTLSKGGCSSLLDKR